MCKLVIENSQLVNAIKKASGSAKETYVLSVSLNKSSDGKNFATLDACNDSTRTTAFLLCETKISEPITVIMGKELREIVYALAQCGNKFMLTIEDAFVTIQCGTSKVPVGILKDAMTLNVSNPENEECLAVRVETEAFTSALYKGGFAYTEKDGKDSSLCNTIALIPLKIAEEFRFRILSVDANGIMAAASHVQFVPDNATLIESIIKDKRMFLLNASFIFKSIEGMEGDNLDMYLFKSQLVIKAVNDFYVMVLKGTDFPINIGDSLFTKVTDEYRFTVESKLLKAAAGIAILNGSTDREKTLAVIELIDGDIKVSSETGKNETVLKCIKSTGKIRIGINVAYLKNILDHSAEKVSIYGISNTTPIFIQSEEETAIFLLPVRLELDE